jgi:hypothetical protein
MSYTQRKWTAIACDRFAFWMKEDYDNHSTKLKESESLQDIFNSSFLVDAVMSSGKTAMVIHAIKDTDEIKRSMIVIDGETHLKHYMQTIKRVYGKNKLPKIQFIDSIYLRIDKNADIVMIDIHKFSKDTLLTDIIFDVIFLDECHLNFTREERCKDYRSFMYDTIIKTTDNVIILSGTPNHGQKEDPKRCMIVTGLHAQYDGLIDCLSFEIVVLPNERKPMLDKIAETIIFSVITTSSGIVCLADDYECDYLYEILSKYRTVMKYYGEHKNIPDKLEIFSIVLTSTLRIMNMSSQKINWVWDVHRSESWCLPSKFIGSVMCGKVVTQLIITRFKDDEDCFPVLFYVETLLMTLKMKVDKIQYGMFLHENVEKRDIEDIHEKSSFFYESRENYEHRKALEISHYCVMHMFKFIQKGKSNLIRAKIQEEMKIERYEYLEKLQVPVMKSSKLRDVIIIP